MFKKLLVSFLLSLVLLFSFAPYFPARAQSTWYLQNPFEWYVKVYDEKTSPPNEIFGERYTAAQVEWVIYSVSSYLFNLPYVLLGMSPSPNVCMANLFQGTADISTCTSIFPDFVRAVTNRLKDMKIIANVQRPPNTASVWKRIFAEDRPISAISYVRNIGRKMKIVPEVKAADTWGYGNLSPILNIWKMTRNLAYFFFTLAIIATAFMVMFRVKISPQAVISVQSALPKIAITLLLVTFSYAIAGLMIDLVYVFMGIFTQFFGDPKAGFNAFDFLMGDILSVSAAGNFIPILIYSIIYIALYLVVVIFLILFALLGGLNITSIIVGLILLVFIVGIFVILLVNLFAGAFTLFKTLASFYVSVIIGPIQIAFDAVPGMGGRGFSGWLKSIISKLAVFPVTGILWYFAFGFLVAALGAGGGCAAKNWQSLLGLDQAIASSQELIATVGFQNFWGFLFSPPAGKCWGPPLLGDAAGATGIAFLLISIGCIIAITKVPKQIESFMAGKGYLETGIGEAMGPFASLGSFASKYGTESAMDFAARYLKNKSLGEGGERGVWKIVRNLLASAEKKGDETRLKGPGDLR